MINAAPPPSRPLPIPRRDVDCAFVLLLLAFVLQYSTLIIGSLALDRLIKLGALVAMVCGFRYAGPRRSDAVVLLLYGMLFAATTVGALATADLAGLAQASKFALGWAPLPLLLLYKHRQGLSHRLAKAVIVVGVLFSLQAVALVVGVTEDWVSETHTVTIGTRDGMEMPSFGLLGYASAHGYAGYGQQYVRAQSWFSEPSSLAVFLLGPACWAWGLYRRERRRRYLIASAMCVSGLVATFSIAAAIGLAAATAMSLLVRSRMQRWPRAVIVGFAIGGLALGALVAQFILAQSHEVFVNESDKSEITALARMVGRDPNSAESGSLVRQAFNLESSLALIGSHPLGIGLGFTGAESDRMSPNAVLFWGVAGGVPALLILSTLQAWLFFSQALPALLDRDPLARSAATAYLAVTVHGLSYGTWASSYYVLVVAMLLITRGPVGNHDIDARRSDPSRKSAIPVRRLWHARHDAA